MKQHDRIGIIETGTVETTKVQAPTKLQALVRAVRRRHVNFVLRHCSIGELDHAVKDKIGKYPSRSLISREKAKSYNEGFLAAIEKVRATLDERN